jgi:drug/metabolite transporter (DMT)-like permease
MWASFILVGEIDSPDYTLCNSSGEIMNQNTDTNGGPESTPSGGKTRSDRATTLKIWVGILGGLALQVSGLLLRKEGVPTLSTYWWLMVVFGAAVFVWGSCALAESKGYSRAWGLLGLASLLGLILLGLFPRLEKTDPGTPEYQLGILQRNVILGLTLGLGGVLFLCSALGGRDSFSNPGFAVLLLSYVLSIWGCYSLVRRKGRHWAWALASILTIPGWFLLFLLPDRHRKEHPQLNYSLKEFQRGMVVLVVICAILIAIQIPMYVSYKRAKMDRAASSDATKLAKIIQRISHECSVRNCEPKPLPSHFLEYLVGPYYGWEGTDRKSEVLIRIEDNVICACSSRGSRPISDREHDHYIYRVNIATGEQLPAVTGPCTGKSYGGGDAACYEETVIGSDCAFRKPQGKRCK